MRCGNGKGMDTDEHSGTIRWKGLLKAEIWKGRTPIIFVKEVVGCVMRDCDAALMYGYAYPCSEARKCSRIHRLPLTTVAFEGPIDKG
jgi:hypothetical protein